MTEIDVWTTSPLLNFDHIIEDIRGFGDGLACGCGCGNNGIFGIGYGYMMDTIGNTDDCAFSGYGDAAGLLAVNKILHIFTLFSTILYKNLLFLC